MNSKCNSHPGAFLLNCPTPLGILRFLEMYPKLPREVFCPRTKGYREIIYRFENQNLEQNALPDTSWHLNVANFKQTKTVVLSRRWGGGMWLQEQREGYYGRVLVNNSWSLIGRCGWESTIITQTRLIPNSDLILKLVTESTKSCRLWTSDMDLTLGW